MSDQINSNEADQYLGSDIEANDGDYRILLSALSDGELSSMELEKLLSVLGQNDEKSRELKAYWVRLNETKNLMAGNGVISAENGLEERIADAISQIAQDQQAGQVESSVLTLETTVSSNDSPANDERFSFIQNLSIAASVMLVVVMGWMGSQEPVREGVKVALGMESEVASENVVALAGNKEFDSDQLSRNLIEQERLTHKVVAGNVSASNKEKASLFLSGNRMKSYMRLHANNASLNGNQGMIPFARIDSVTAVRQF